MADSTSIISNICADTPMWLGVAKDAVHHPAFYLIQLLDVITENDELTIKFSSDDNINDILKTVRSNEVWGKPVDFLLLTVGAGLFSPWKIIKLYECLITTVAKNGTTHTWAIQFAQVKVMYQ